MNLYKLHVEQLLLGINELLPEDHFIRHSNSYNYLVREMNEFENSELSEQEKEIIISAIKEHAKYPIWILTELKRTTSFENLKCAGELLVIYESIIKKLEKNENQRIKTTD